MRANQKELKQDEEVEVLDTSLRVTTPEKVSFQYQVVGPFRRAVSYALDFLCSLFLFWLISFIGGLVYVTVILPLATSVGLGSVVTTLGAIFAGMWLMGLFIVYWFYGALMEAYFLTIP